MKLIKKALCCLVSLLMIFSVCVLPASAQSYFSENFKDYDGTALPNGMWLDDSGRGAKITAAPCEDRALALSTGSGTIASDFVPALAFNLPVRAEGTITLAMDVNFYEFNEGKTTDLLSFYITDEKDASGKLAFDYRQLAFRTDKSGGAWSNKTVSFQKNTWYRLEIVFDFESAEKTYSARLSDLQTDAVLEAVPRRALDQDFKSAAGIRYVEIGLAAADAQIHLDNIEIYDVAAAEILFPTADIELAKCGDFSFSASVPAGAKTAEFFLDDSLVGTATVTGEGIYSIPVDLTNVAPGEHKAGVTINGDSSKLKQTAFRVGSDSEIVWGESELNSVEELARFVAETPLKCETEAEIQVGETAGRRGLIISGDSNSALSLKLERTTENKLLFGGMIYLPENKTLEAECVAADGSIINQGQTALTSGVAWKAGEWNSCIWYFDFANGTYTVFINAVPTYGGAIDGKILSEIRLQSSEGDDLHVALDDLRIASFEQIPEIAKLSSVLPDGIEIFDSSWVDGKLDLQAEKLRIYSSVPLLPESVNADRVHLTNGVALAADAVQYNESLRAVEITLPVLSSGTEYRVIFEEGVQSSAGAELGRWEYLFTTAPREFMILSPEQDGVYQDGELLCRVTAPGGFSSLVFALDGRELTSFTPNPSEVYEFVLSREALPYGNHTFSAWKIDASGAMEEKQTAITVNKSVQSVKTFDFDDYDGVTVPAGLTYVGSSLRGSSMQKAEGKDNTVGFKMHDAYSLGKEGGNCSYLEVKTGEVKSVLTIETDFNISDPGVWLRFENSPWKQDGWKMLEVLDGGKIGNCVISPQVWHRLKVEINFAKGYVKYFVDGVECGKETIGMKYATAIKLELASKEKDDAYIIFDNLSYTIDMFYALPGRTAYLIDGIETDAGEGVNVQAQALRQYFTSELDGDSLTTDTVKVLAGGVEVPLSRVSYNSSGGFLTAELNSPLSAGKEGRIVVLPEARFGDGVRLGSSFDIPFQILPKELGLQEVVLKKDGIAIKSTEQLRSNDLISAAVTLSNSTQQNRSAMAALAFYQDGKLIGITSVTKTIAEASDTLQIDNHTIPYRKGMTVKVLVCDSWVNRKPVASWSLSGHE